MTKGKKKGIYYKETITNGSSETEKVLEHQAVLEPADYFCCVLGFGG